MLRTLWSRKWLLLVPVVIGAGIAAVVSTFWLPVRYESHTVIMVVPPRVGPDYVRPATAGLEQQLDSVLNQITSRTRMERMILDFDLYREERRAGRIMQEVVAQMQDDVVLTLEPPAAGRIGTTFKISFIGPDPRTTQRVTEKLASQVIDNSVENARLLADNTAIFLESQSEQARQRLLAMEAKLAALGRRPNVAETTEFELLRETYRSLLEKQQSVRLARELDKRNQGVTFKPVEPPVFPERPVGPTRAHMNLMGAGAGLVMGLVLVAALPRRR
jgi:uncharacterized protein involved in exopolysaccharide biosynthesis